jgi:hypothetical protein
MRVTTPFDGHKTGAIVWLLLESASSTPTDSEFTRSSVLGTANYNLSRHLAQCPLQTELA